MPFSRRPRRPRPPERGDAAHVAHPVLYPLGHAPLVEEFPLLRTQLLQLPPLGVPVHPQDVFKAELFQRVDVRLAVQPAISDEDRLLDPELLLQGPDPLAHRAAVGRVPRPDLQGER